MAEPVQKSADAFRTISEVSDELKLPQHVLRFWETRFPQIKPLKRGGNRRFYRPEDVELLRAVRTLLYGEGYTIRGVQKLLREQGPRAVTDLVRSGRHRPAKRDEAEQPGPASPPDPASAAQPDEEAMPSTVQTAPHPVAAAAGQHSETPRRDSGAATNGVPERAVPHLTERLVAILAELQDCERVLSKARAKDA